MANAIRNHLKGLLPTSTEADIDALFKRTETVFNVIAAAPVGETQCWLAKFSGTIQSVTYVPDTALAVHAANYVTLTLNKNPASGYGSHVAVASHTTNSTGGTAMVADTPWALSTLTAANQPFVTGDAFTFTLADAATTTEPLGCLVIEYTLEDS
jgi:hypothetical protein